MKKLGLALAMLVTLGLGACGDDDGGGEEGGGSSGNGAGNGGGAGRGGSGGGAGRAGSTGSGTGSGSTADDIAMCMMMGTAAGNADCEGIDEYTTCVMDACKDEYEICLGPNYLKGDFSGGMCESLGECAETAADPCTCDADMECINCFVDNLVSCAMTCPLPSCTGGGGGTAGSGGLPASDKTCADLEACCMSLDAQIGMACMSQYEIIKAAGDAACGAAYSAYASLGCD